MSFTHILPATTTFPQGQDDEALPEGGKLLSSTEALRLTRAISSCAICLVLDPIQPIAMPTGTAWRLITTFIKLLYKTLWLSRWRRFDAYIIMLWAGTAKPFARIATDLHPDNPRFDHLPRPPTPDGAFNCLAAGLEREGVVGPRRRKMVGFQAYKRFEHMVGTVSRGLGWLCIVLDKMDREKTIIKRTKT